MIYQKAKTPNNIGKQLIKGRVKSLVKARKYSSLINSRQLIKSNNFGEEGIGYWETRIATYKKLSQEEAVARLIKAEKVEAKISTIKKAIEVVQS